MFPYSLMAPNTAAVAARQSGVPEGNPSGPVAEPKAFSSMWVQVQAGTNTPASVERGSMGQATGLVREGFCSLSPPSDPRGAHQGSDYLENLNH